MTPIAMKCSQENWEEIKPLLEKAGLKIILIDSFDDHHYLVNNYQNILGIITNLAFYDISKHHRVLYETWDINTFLEACDLPTISTATLYTIEDLKKGKCAVINDGSLEELQEVLKMAFPRDAMSKGTGLYYKTNSDYDYIWEIVHSTALPKQSVKDFLKQIEVALPEKYPKNNNDMVTDSRFHFYLNPDNAQQIIDIACSTWKTKLATMWANDIVLNKQISISEKFYKEMRKACTTEQNALFDTIFGKDVIEYPYKDGELIWVKIGDMWELRYSNGTLDKEGNACTYKSQKREGLIYRFSQHRKANNIELPKD